MSANPSDPWEEALRQAQENIEKGAIPTISRQRGGDVIDPRDQFAKAPEFNGAHLLPAIYNAYVDDCVAGWGGDRGAYAVNFMAVHCGVLHSSVKMNTNPLKPGNFRNPNDFALTLGRSGQNKSGMFKDLTRHQEAWQKAMSRASTRVTSARASQAPMCFLQNASIEGLMLQIADNRGERLLMASEEAMSFYDGAALHHKDNNASAMSNAVCQVYDGGMFSKRLVGKVYSIPEALATLIMTTTIDKIVGWKAFAVMVDSGLMARHTVGVLSHIEPRDSTKLVPGAEQAMGDVLLKMRGMRDYRFVLEEEAQQPWLDFTLRKEATFPVMALRKEKEGLINWARKYDMRIMTMATILQCYDYIAGGMVGAVEEALPPEPTHDGKVADARILRTLRISTDNLRRAIRFVEGYLYDMQEFFYNVAEGVTEFGDELMNFVAYRVTCDEPDNPDCRVISRSDLTTKGPAVCRGAVTPERKEQWNRWIQALLDHGFVEVYEHPRARNLTRQRSPCEERWFKVRDEVFEFFNSDDDRNWLRAHYENSREVIGRGTKRAPLDL